MRLKEQQNNKTGLTPYIYLLTFLITFAVCTKMRASVYMEGRVFAGGQYAMRGGIYKDAPLFEEKLPRFGGVLGIGIGIYNFSSNIKERLGIIVEVMSHYYLREDVLNATCSVWGLTFYYQYDFIKPKKGKLTPFIIAGPSLLYYSIQLESEDHGLDVKDRHYKIAVMAGWGLNYFISDKFAFEFMLRAFYIPSDKNMISVVATIGFRTIF
jgi:hypothetical protein